MWRGWKMSLEDDLITQKHRKGTKAHTLKHKATAKVLSSKSLSLHTISDTIQAVETWTLWTNALENFIWILYSPEIRVGWLNCKRNQEEVRGSIQGETPLVRSKGKPRTDCRGNLGCGEPSKQQWSEIRLDPSLLWAWFTSSGKQILVAYWSPDYFPQTA